MNKIIQIGYWPFRKAMNYTKALNNLLESPTNLGNKGNFIYERVTKITGATTGACGFGKGASDALEAFACQDGICFVVSCIGTSADVLQVMASYVPGPNVTITVTLPISWGCKVFVYCCKHSKLPWGSC